MTITHHVVFDIGPHAHHLIEKLLMATLSDFTAKLDSIDSKVTALAAELADLKDKLATGGMTAADEDTALARVAAIETALGALVSTA